MSAFLARNRLIVLAYAGMIALLLVTALFSPGFLSVSNMRSTVVLAAFVGIVAFGQTFVIICGGIDLSVPCVLNSAAIVMALLCGGQNFPLLWLVPLLLGFCMGLALTNTFSADFAAFANANFAQVAGIVGAVIATRLIRVIGPQTAAQRVLRAGWRDLSAIAARRLKAGVSDWTGLMLDRAQLLAPRLAASRGHERLAAADALRDLRVGINLITLRDTPEARDRLDALLDAVAGHYAGEAERAPSPALRDDIDGALRETRGLETRLALTGLRRNLFPLAEAPRMEAAR